jgi:hypothetical protein
MAAPTITIQRFHIGCDARSQRVQMYVPDKRQKIPFFLAENRFIAILKKVSRPSVSFIEVDSVPGKKPSHGARNADIPALQQQMHVVAHQRPCIEGALRAGDIFAEFVNEPPPIRIIGKETAFVNPPNDDVMQGAGSIQAGMSRHESSLWRVEGERQYKSH